MLACIVHMARHTICMLKFGALGQRAHRRLTCERMCRAAPQQFRYAECAGRMVGPSTWLFSGCVPRDDAMPAFSDFVTFLAGRRAASASADAPAGRLRHFIVGNEARAGPEHPANGDNSRINARCSMKCCSCLTRIKHKLGPALSHPEAEPPEPLAGGQRGLVRLQSMRQRKRAAVQHCRRYMAG